MTPQRIQRKRTKGWKMPENTIYVGRNAHGAGRFGNPFRIGGMYKIGEGRGKPGFLWFQVYDEKNNDGTFEKVRDREHSLEMYKTYRERYPLSENDKELLRGKNLCCWCSLDQECHADILLKLANE